MSGHIRAPRACTPVVITEMQYASDLLRRAETAIAREFDVLRAAGVEIDWNASQGLCMSLLGMAMDLHILSLRATEARCAAGVGRAA